MIILELLAILGLAWLLRWPARAVGLPSVIGEMLTGFLLGPTLLGAFAPQVFHAAFPPEGIREVGELATLIVTAYCFMIGLEFDPTRLSGRSSALAITSLACALFPAVAGYYAAGAMAARMGAPTPASFNLAVSLCFSATAFPVLLRIVEDAGMTGQPVGIFSIGISAILELLIWACLPVILAIGTAGNPAQAGIVIAWVGGVLLAWFTVVRKGLEWLWKKIPIDGLVSLFYLACVGVVSAWLTDRLGIHANFGAFVGGFVVPRSVSGTLAKKIKPACVFLLPVFFAAAGLKTTLALGNQGEVILLLAITILAYTVKAFGTALAARLTSGLDWNNS